MQRSKFQVQQKLMDFSSKIRYIAASVICEKHNAKLEEPCFSVDSGVDMRAYSGVCGSRTRKMFAAETKRPMQKEYR